VDRFGNAITNLVAARGGTLEVAGHALPIRRTYGDAAAGAPLALAGSSGLVEVAVRDGSAARTLGLARGARVLLRPPRQAGESR
jgi:S-adenosylmethionine hydrolase